MSVARPFFGEVLRVISVEAAFFVGLLLFAAGWVLGRADFFDRKRTA